MSVDLNARILQEPSTLPGLLPTGRIDHLFVPHDDAPMGYWRKPDGHVILSQYGDNGTEKKLDRGYGRLGTYGSYSSAAMANLKDPLLPLVLAGGLKELPAEQIKLLGWHRAPDRAAKRSHREVDALVAAETRRNGGDRTAALLAVLPQLADYDLTDHVCAAHPGRFFPSLAAKQSHDVVMHKEAIQSESIGKAVAAANAGLGTAVTSGDAAASNEALVNLIAQQGEIIARLTAKVDALEGAKPKGKTTKEAAAE